MAALRRSGRGRPHGRSGASRRPQARALAVLPAMRQSRERLLSAPIQPEHLDPTDAGTPVPLHTQRCESPRQSPSLAAAAPSPPPWPRNLPCTHRRGTSGPRHHAENRLTRPCPRFYPHAEISSIAMKTKLFLMPGQSVDRLLGPRDGIREERSLGVDERSPDPTHRGARRRFETGPKGCGPSREGQRRNPRRVARVKPGSYADGQNLRRKPIARSAAPTSSDHVPGSGTSLWM